METIFVISTVLLWFAVLFNLLLTVALARRIKSQSGHLPANMPDFENVPTLEIGEPAPDFTAEDLNENIVSLTSYAQRNVALVFISSHCAPCVDELPLLNRLGTKAKQHAVDMVLVNIGDDRRETEAFVEKYDIRLPILTISPGNSMMRQYNKAGITPFFCLINSDGIVQATGSFNQEWEKLTHVWLYHQNGEMMHHHA